MEHPDYFYLGYVSKAIGTKGDLSFQLESDQPNAYESLSMIFIDIKGSLIPYQIEKISIKGNRAQVHLQDIDNSEKSGFLIGCKLHLPMSFLPKLKGNSFYFHEVIGFEVKDESFGMIGIIKEISDQGAQAIFQIDHQGTEILIPITDDFVKKVDRKKKIILVQTPEGLIDLYL